MTTPRMTNWLLLGIFLILLTRLIIDVVPQSVLAETFRLDQCITNFPNDKPASYVHVVTHDFSGE